MTLTDRGRENPSCNEDEASQEAGLRPARGRFAIRNASRANSERMCSAIDQPTIRLEKAS